MLREMTEQEYGKLKLALAEMYLVLEGGASHSEINKCRTFLISGFLWGSGLSDSKSIGQDVLSITERHIGDINAFGLQYHEPEIQKMIDDTFKEQP